MTPDLTRRLPQGKHNAQFPAQPENLAVQQAVDMLAAAATALTVVAHALAYEKPGPKKRHELRRQLSRVLANTEIVRQAIKE